MNVDNEIEIKIYKYEDTEKDKYGNKDKNKEKD